MAIKKQKQYKHHFVLLFIGVLLIVGIICFFFIKEKATAPVYSQSLASTYTGELPCADCSGIMTTLTVIPTGKQNGTYVLHELYEGKGITPFVTEGKWNITYGTPTDSKASVLTLTQNNSPQNTYYLIEGRSKLTMLNQKKQSINAPFNESLTAASTENLLSAKIVKQLPSWLPGATWNKPILSPQQTFYGNVIGYEITGNIMTKEASMPHFENLNFLKSLGFAPDSNLSADGPGSSVWGYTNGTNGKKQVILFSYQTQPTTNNPNQPLQFNCPCKTQVTVFISHSF